VVLAIDVFGDRTDDDVLFEGQRRQLIASTRAFVEAFEALARKENAFAYPIEYLKPME